MRTIRLWLLLLILGAILSLAACAPSPTPEEAATPMPTATPTPTLLPPSPTSTSTPTGQPPLRQDTPTPLLPGLCDDLGAEIEVRLILPYAAAAELDPIAAGYVPLSVTTDQEAHTVRGTGHISYDEMQTWIDDAGKTTAEVFLELDMRLDGECVEDATGAGLHLTLNAVHQEEQGATTCGYPPGSCKHSPIIYPYEESFELEFPLVDGATVQRENWTSWTFVLHLQSP